MLVDQFHDMIRKKDEAKLAAVARPFKDHQFILFSGLLLFGTVLRIKKLLSTQADLDSGNAAPDQVREFNREIRHRAIALLEALEGLDAWGINETTRQYEMIPRAIWQDPGYCLSLNGHVLSIDGRFDTDIRWTAIELQRRGAPAADNPKGKRKAPKRELVKAAILKRVPESRLMTIGPKAVAKLIEGDVSYPAEAAGEEALRNEIRRALKDIRR